jgi:hypothetical protein
MEYWNIGVLRWSSALTERELRKNGAQIRQFDALMLGFDPFAVGYFAFIDAQRKSTRGVGASPGLIHY